MALTDYKITGNNENIIYEETGTVPVSCIDSVITFSLDNNNVYVRFGKVKWIEYVNKSNTTKTDIQLFVERNLSNNVRETYISFTNKQTGDTDTFFITQEKCYYGIKIDKNLSDSMTGEDSFSFKDKDTPINVYYKVFGNSCKCTVMDDNFSILKKGIRFIYFDKALSYVVEKKERGNEDGKDYILYCLTIRYLGEITELEKDDVYSVILTHDDNKETLLKLTIDISNVIYTEEEREKKGEELEKVIDEKIPSVTSDYTSENDFARENGCDTNVSTVSLLRNVMSINRNSSVEEQLPSLEIIGIEDNKIYVKSNTYNRKGVLFHNSMILTSKKAKWCNVQEEYISDKGEHELTIMCNPNSYQNLRKSYIFLNNAERPKGTKKFLVIQDKEGNIVIEKL